MGNVSAGVKLVLASCLSQCDCCFYRFKVDSRPLALWYKRLKAGTRREQLSASAAVVFRYLYLFFTHALKTGLVCVLCPI